MDKTCVCHYSLHLHLGLGIIAAPNVFDRLLSFGWREIDPGVEDVVLESLEKIIAILIGFQIDIYPEQLTSVSQYST